MATITPHTTRAIGTVLTASIYNADHVNHVTNVNSLFTDLLATPVAPGSSGFPEGAAPATPAANFVRLYAKTDGNLYQKDDAGLETVLAGGGSAAVEVGPTTPQGRLSLVTGEPIVKTTQAAKTSIFYVPYIGALAPFWDGTNWLLIKLAELTLPLDSNSGHTGYHQANKNFDLLLDYNAGTPRLVSSPAWTSDIARADALMRKDGIRLNNASMVVRFGTAAGDTATIAAQRLTQIGTFRTSSTNGQTEFIFGGVAAGGTAGSLLLWNAYNRVPHKTRCSDSTDSWTYGSSTFRPSNNSPAMRHSFITGEDTDAYLAIFSGRVQASASGAAFQGIGIDVTNAVEPGAAAFSPPSADSLPVATLVGTPIMGFHFLQAVERSNAGTATFYGDFTEPTVQQNSFAIMLWL